MVLNNNELNAEILRKAFEGADLGVVCVRGKGFIESDDDNLCYLFGFDDGFECFVMKYYISTKIIWMCLMLV